MKGLLHREDCRREHRKWNPGDNADYRYGVLEMADAVRAAFPVRMGITKINGCLQEKGESVHAFYHRLNELFNKHGGIAEPNVKALNPLYGNAT